MTPPARSSPAAALALLALLLAGGMAMAWYSLPGRPLFSTEALIRAGVGQDLLDGHTRGRQGLVGSLYWSPLPTLAALPFLRLAAPFDPRWAFVFVAVGAAALLGLLLNAWLRRNGVLPGFRFAAVLLLFCSPPFRHGMTQGDTNLLFLFLAVSAVCFLLSWWENDQLRSLGYLTVSLMLAMITRHQAALLFLAAAGFVAVHLYAHRRRPHYAEATLTIFLVPPLYAAAIWVTANWLIMGDPLFFLRGVPQAFHSRSDLADLLVGGCDWPLVGRVALIAVVTWFLGGLARRRSHLWAGLPALLLCGLLWPGAPAESAPLQDPTDLELQTSVVPYLNAHHAGDWVAVSGYRGYELARWNADGRMQRLSHSLSFYLEPTLQDTRGRRLYLLVPEPVGRDRWEDINLKFPSIFWHETPFTVHEHSWNHWRLLRVVRMDETDRR